MAEGASLSMMAESVLPSFSPYYNLLWRFSTAYVGAMVGLLFLLRAAIQNMTKIYGRQQKRTGFPIACYFRQNRDW